MGCGNDPQPNTETPKSGVSESDSLITIKSGGENISLIVPKSIISDEFRAQNRTNFGDVEVYANPKLHFTVSLEDLNLSELKSELKSGGLFTFKFYDESDDMLLYQSILPDGTELGFHLIQNKKIKNKTYVVRSNPQSEFSLQNIRALQKVTNTLH